MEKNIDITIIARIQYGEHLGKCLVKGEVFEFNELIFFNSLNSNTLGILIV